VSIKFNVEKPFDSMAMFSNAQAFLTEEQKDSFSVEASQFFSEKGYRDEAIEIPAEYRERFLDDLAILLGIKALDHPEKMRTLAAVEKVTGCHFTGLSREFQVYPLEVERPEKLATRWGWVAALDCKGLGLNEPAINSNTEGYDPQGAIIRTAAPVLTEHETYTRKFIPAPTPKSSAEAVAPSRFFNPEQPFESIARFSDRFSILNHQEQKSMVATVRNFFLSKAAEEKTVELPANYRERFSKVDLKLLLDLLPQTFSDRDKEKFEKDRFIAAVQKVTQLQFTSLKKEDRVYPIVMDYKTAHTVAHNQFSGWLGHGNAEITFTAAEENCGYAKAQPIHLEGMTPLIALTLQLFQYEYAHRDALMVKGHVEPLVDLLCLARKYSWNTLRDLSFTKLQDAIVLALKRANTDSNFHTTIARMLHKSGVQQAMKDFKMGILQPDTESLSDEALYQTLRYNLSYLNGTNFASIVNCSIGRKTPNNLIALIRFRREIQEEQLCKQIDEYVAEYIFGLAFKESYNKYNIKKFIADRIQNILRASEPTDLAPQLDRQLWSYQFSEKEGTQLIDLFERQDVRQFLIETQSREKPDDIINDIRTYYQVLKPSTVRVEEAFSHWQAKEDSCPAQFSSALKQLCEIVSKRYQDKRARVERVFVALDNCLGNRSNNLLEMFFEAYCNPGDRFDKTLQSRLPKINVKEASVKKICSILATEDFRLFLMENDIDLSAIDLLRQYLESEIKRNKVSDSIKNLRYELLYEKSEGNQLSSAIAFMKGWKSSPDTTPEANPSCLLENRDRYDRAEQLLKSFSLLAQKESITLRPCDWSECKKSIDELETACFIRSFLDTFVAEDKRKIKNFFHDQMLYICKRIYDHHHEGFDKRIKEIPFEDAEALLNAIEKQEAQVLFAEYNFLSQKEFFINRLKAYIATNPKPKPEPKQSGGWFW